MVHPCFNPIAHFKYGRIHLPVAARCNIQCKYCIRRISKCEDRPGVSSAIHKVNDAVEWLRRNVKKNSELKVVGIAGPGDALANEETYKLFKIVDDEFPGLIKCLSTNGLLLQERVNALVNLNVRTVTVTVNTVNPKIGSKIYDWISYGGRMYYGVEGADILLHKQLEGIKRASKKGIAVKVNTVFIPEINNDDVVNVAKKAAEQGAFRMNIIPLIPLHKFKNLRKPSCEELTKARDECERIIPQFRFCKQCRADACGIPGSELPPEEKSSHLIFHY